MKRLATFAFALCAAFTMSQAQSLSPSTKTHWEKGTLVVETPQRPAGQQSALGLTVPAMKTVRVGFVGLGMRGPWAVMRFANIPGVQIVALCDFEEKRAEGCQKYLKEKGLPPAEIYSGAKGYEELCKRNDIDLVYVATDWNHHFPVAMCAMENGKNAAIEVPSAMNLEQCWALINMSEKTRKHCMVLENCCYDYYEMNALNMAQKGVFGEILRAEGAYIHNLDDFWEAYWMDPDDKDTGKLHWRMKYNMENRGDVYATHGLGPVAQCLDIHRGDRFTVLTAMDTKSVHGKEWVKKKTGKDVDFRNGDHTTTLMRTANGKVVEIQHNVMTPQPYNRLFKLTGTKGYATKYPEEHFALDASALKEAKGAPNMDDLSSHGFMNAKQQEELVKAYYHPILAKYGELGREMGHGGMDFIMDSRLVYCLQNGLPLDMDVYDMAEWCCLAELGTLSMDNNCCAVSFPDFTRGDWNKVSGYRHAYANADQEAAQEAAAKASTEAQKQITTKLKLWDLYDAKKDGNAKAVKAYQKAMAKAQAALKKSL